MNKDKNQQLAREITAFCKERLKSPSEMPRRPGPVLQIALVSFLVFAFTNAGVDPNRKTFWVV